MALGSTCQRRSDNVLLALIVGLALLSSCREAENEPAYNQSLGSEQAPLLPTASILLDQNILQGPRVQATELPAFHQDMPTLAEIERAPKAADAPSPSDQEEREAEEEPPEDDATLDADEQ
ncbi:MAG: hypothetical protein JSU68_11995 [Phycisphaerales bacterium]|nr:MAG: hypothetical protein JSU68_11995 [Phycisphaerales bacterium]